MGAVFLPAPASCPRPKSCVHCSSMRALSLTLLLASTGQINADISVKDCTPIWQEFCIGDIIQQLGNLLQGQLSFFINYNVRVPGIFFDTCNGFPYPYKKEYEDVEYLPDSRPNIHKAPLDILSFLPRVGEVPKKDNFFFEAEYKVPVWVAFDAMNKQEKDGGWFDVIEEGFEGDPSPYSGYTVMVNGLHALGAAGIEEQVIAFNASVSNYSYTYRIANIISPIATGGLVTLGVKPGEDPQKETVFFMKGRIAGVLPDCITSILNPYSVWDPLLRATEQEWKDDKYKYMGPPQPPNYHDIAFPAQPQDV